MKKAFFKNILLCLTVIFLLAGILCGCGKSEDSAVKQGSRMNLKYTKNFDIEYVENGCKIVTDGEERRLLLVPQGKKVPAGYDGLPVIHIPVKKVLFTSMTQVALLNPLGVWESVTGVTSPADQWYIDEVKKGLEDGSMVFVGDGYKPDYEKIQKLKPDLVFIYTGPYGLSDLQKKLEELGIPYAVDNEYLEEEPLGRLEWIKFIAAFYDKEEEAQKYFDGVVERIEEIKKKVEKESSRPKVAWGSIFEGKVYVPRGGSYVARLIDMAGGEYIFADLEKDKGGSATVTLEEFYDRARDADVFVYSSSVSFVPSVDAILKQAPVLGDLKVIKEGNVWCYQPWYFQILDKTDEVLKDLAAIFHPGLYGDHEVKHYFKLPEK